MTRILALVSRLVRSPRPALAAGRAGLAALALGLAAASPAAAQAPDTVWIVNRATLTFRGADGSSGTAEAEAGVAMDRVRGVRLTPPRAVAAHPGERRVLPHLLENTGNGPDAFRLEAAGPAGWGVALHLDLDGDGVLGAADPAVTGPLPLGRDGSAALLLVVDVPEDAPDAGDFDLTLTAASTAAASVTASLADVVSVRRPLPALSLTKGVDRADATAGDTLTYTIAWTNRGDGATPAASLADALPAGVRFVAGSLRLNGAPLTDAPDADAGTVVRAADGTETVRAALGALTPGAAGTLVFRAVVGADAPERLSNVAVLSHGATEISTPAAVARVSAGEIAIDKAWLGEGPVRVGGETRFRISWSNPSATVAVREAVLTDTLPEGLAFVSATLAPEVEGRVLRWRLGTVAPGATASLELVTRAVSVPASGEVVNRAVARGANAAAAAAAALAFQVVDFDGDELELTKAAGVLEAGAGEGVPYALTLRNRGPVALNGIVVRDRLPAGVRYLADRLSGADSARLEGRDLVIHLATLAAGETRTVRYAVVVESPGAGALENRAVAEAEGGRVRSDTARAWVRVRRGFAMQSRVVIGKVWVDVDDDGRQDPGEPTVPNAEVWSEDGEVVTTDAEGRFSFRDLRAGGHVLRLDTLGLARDFAGYTVRRGEEIASVRHDGWTTPRVNFRLVPRAPGAPAEAAGPAAPAAPDVKGGGVAQPSAAAAARADSARPTAPVVAALRTAEERKAEEDRAFVEGPPVRIAAPADGAVVASNRLYVGVQGEAGAAVRLFVGAKPVGEGVLRPDGRLDFVGVELAPGPQVVRVMMRGTWGRERWDSVAVHRAGAPARFELPGETPTLRADAREATPVRVQVLDEWGVPVSGAAVTVEARLAEAKGADADGSSVGLQLASGADGVLAVALQPGHEVGPGELRLAAGEAKARVPFRVFPGTRPLIATGGAQVGVGAAPEAYGAVTVRGALRGETSVSVSVDSRRDGEEEEFFGRGYDPLEEGRYPTFGDDSERRVLSSSTQRMSARVEHGYDRVEVGDVETPDFGGDDRLGLYRRSLTGVSARVGTGPVVWQGFGSYTDQVLGQRQLRGDGTTGPYRFGAAVRPGTERIAIEVRARDNAARVLLRQELARFVEYQIDYATGDVLLQRPVPSTDAEGNPVFVVGLLELRSGGERDFVGGLRMELDAAKVVRLPGVDSLGVALLGVRDGAGAVPGGAGRDLLGGSARMRRQGLEVGAELLRSHAADSSAFASRADLAWTLRGDRARFAAGWLRVGEGFSSSTDPRLSAGLTELRLSGDLRVAKAARLGLTHERQRFDGYDVERQSTRLRAEQTVAGRSLVAEGGVSTDAHGDRSSSSAVGKVTMSVTPRMDFWLEGTRALSEPDGPGATLARPDQVGAGLSYRVMDGVRLEGVRRWVGRGDSAYALTTFNVRGDGLLGGSVWGGVERADLGRAEHSAVLGWSPRLVTAGGWQMDASYERRFGLDRTSLLDPVRALPFAAQERDRWAASAGVQYLPGDSAARFSLRAETHDGALGRGYRFDAAGDAPLGRSAALLTRHDWLQDDVPTARGSQLTRRDRSLVALAMRPVENDALNLLAKVEWRRTVSPLGAGLLGIAGDQRRLIGATDAVWEPGARTDLFARYAVRWATVGGDTVAGGDPLATLAHYAGLRAEQELRGRFRARLDGRMLLAEGGEPRWNLAPSLLVGVMPNLEVEAGYRFGDLRDPDFAATGGQGFFATLGFRFTEELLGGAAGFWRRRLADER